MRDPHFSPASWTFVAGGRQPRGGDDKRLFCFAQDRILLAGDGSVPTINEVDFLDASLEMHYVGRCHGEPCVAVSLPDPVTIADHWQLVDLRRFGLQQSDDALFSMAARASQILRWRATHRFCSACGSSTTDHKEDFATLCSACGYAQYPRISPCIIVLVTRGDEALLARGANFGRPMYSTLAGFMEPGESAEDAVRREVWEETGIEVGQPVYHSSQSWPFPHSLMLGFHARYLSGDICVDEREIIHAEWFTRDRLPLIPPPPSISRRLIDAWLEQ